VSGNWGSGDSSRFQGGTFGTLSRCKPPRSKKILGGRANLHKPAQDICHRTCGGWLRSARLGHLDGHVFISPSQKRIRVLHIRVGDFLHIDLTHHSATRSRFNRRKLEDQRRETAENETASRRATDAQVLEDAERLTARIS
jgi:hypothetical protein